MAQEPSLPDVDASLLQAWRREFHQFPETGWCEFRTSARLAELLAPIARLTPGRDFLHRSFLYDRDVKVAVEQSRAAALGADDKWLEWLGPLPGLIATIDSGEPGPTIALRVDIDALGLDECGDSDHPPARHGFQSCFPGVCHGCGHDGHMAIGLGVAHWLAANKSAWRGRFLLICQPAEEGCRGGRAIAESGALDDVERLFGFHLGMGFGAGTLVTAAEQFLSTTKFDVQFKGLAAHASIAPQLGRNALAAACQAVTQMLAIPRHGDGITRVNIGTLNAGSSRNIIPEQALLRGEVRGASDEVNQYLMAAVSRIVDGCAISHEVRGKLTLAGESCTIRQSPALVALATAVGHESGLFSNLVGAAPFGASEDASWLMRRVQEQGGDALYLVFGCAVRGGHHTSRFDFDEAVMATAVRYLCQLLCRTSQY
ncbi:MAG: amidohydrolase [Corallincola sp.]|nr:amidohydrolase [Corallincola sp.]